MSKCSTMSLNEKLFPLYPRNENKHRKSGDLNRSRGRDREMKKSFIFILFSTTKNVDHFISKCVWQNIFHITIRIVAICEL